MSSDDEGYVHRPGGEQSDAVGSGANASEANDGPATHADPDGFGVHGWVLVGVLVVCTLVVPGVIYIRPGILSAVGIPYIVSLLILPLVPAAALGLTAVWAMTAATKND